MPSTRAFHIPYTTTRTRMGTLGARCARSIHRQTQRVGVFEETSLGSAGEAGSWSETFAGQVTLSFRKGI
ncbi:hypothetical protein ILYODFUR_017236 [Ilyodon furcidens]|uniref:Uncharacterized protein n=1 Tax=Ilyodon furcidens TaxID=33524 RepID=A0ABV0VEP3_9TELE